MPELRAASLTGQGTQRSKIDAMRTAGEEEALSQQAKASKAKGRQEQPGAAEADIKKQMEVLNVSSLSSSKQLKAAQCPPELFLDAWQ